MGLNSTKMTLGGRACRLYGEDAPFLLVQPVDERDLDGLGEEAAHIAALTDTPFRLVAFEVGAWDQELTPWAWDAGEALRGRRFGDGAGETLAFIRDELFPALGARDAAHTLLGGYSLAGLFALWAGYASRCFGGVAGVSPSVWYVDWDAFISENAMNARFVYLSQGDREARGRGPMAAAADAIRRQYARLGGPDNPDCALEWNPGNHFREPDLRTAKGFAWLLEHMKGR